MTRPVLTALALLVLFGCAANVRCPSLTQPIQSATLDTFSYEPVQLSPEVMDTEPRDDLIIEKLRFKILDVEDIPNRFIAHLMRPKSMERPAPAIIMLPPTEGTYDLLISFGEFFVKRGYVTLILERRSSFFKPERADLLYDKRLMIQTVIDVRRSIDWLQSQAFVDPERIGILGISLGAVISELATAADPRIKGAAFLLGSSGLDQVLLKSGYSRLIQYRRNILEKLEGTNTDKMLKIKQELASIDPKNYANSLDPKKVIFIYALFDAIVPYSISRETICTFNNPKAYGVPAGHYSTFIYKNWALKKVFQHFEETFALPQGF